MCLTLDPTIPYLEINPSKILTQAHEEVYEHVCSLKYGL